MRRFNEKINMDLDLHIEAKKSSIKKFIRNAADHFVMMGYVPTFEQVYDYVSSDRWAKSCIYDGANCSATSGDFECVSLEDLCETIINICSFNVLDVYESKSYPIKKLRIKE
jgi:hypothetical protein